MWIIIVGSVVAVLVSLLLIPLHLIINANGDGVDVRVRYLLFKKRVADENGLIQKRGKNKKKPKKKKPGQSGDTVKKKKKVDIISTVQLITTLVGDLLKRIGKYARVTLYSYDVCIASDDAAKTAVLYGAVSAAAQIFIDTLSEFRFFRTKCYGNSGVRVDFLATETSCDISLGVSLSPVGALAIAVSLGLDYVKNKMNRNKERDNYGKQRK
ncbi:MAG: hypothetical protein MJ101_03635 [Clostridia bacterium]|nr:hypothetical protein [Clostridia bacterium]